MCGVNVLTLFRKKLPEMLISSHLTTTIFCPERICFETIEANRPRRWPFPSMTMGLEENVAICRSLHEISRENVVSMICNLQRQKTRLPVGGNVNEKKVEYARNALTLSTTTQVQRRFRQYGLSSRKPLLGNLRVLTVKF